MRRLSTSAKSDMLPVTGHCRRNRGVNDASSKSDVSTHYMSDKRSRSGLRGFLLLFASCGHRGLATVLIGVWAASPTSAATSFNATSPLGINLSFVDYWTSEQP